MYMVLLSVAPKLVNAWVCWFTDNHNVAHILQVGSKKPHLHAVALKKFNMSIQYQIHLEPEWIPREMNEMADLLSRIVDHDDWHLNAAIFAWLDSTYGPLAVNPFADYNNHQLPCFNCRCWNSSSEAVNTLMVNWGAENNRWCPPVALIPRVIAHAQASDTGGTLIAAEWKMSPFWPVLHSAMEKFADFVLEIKKLFLSEFLILPGVSGCTLFNGKPSNTRVLALRCDFSMCIL